MKITIKDEIDLERIIDSGQCFRPCRVADGVYRFITGRHSVEIKDETFLSGKKEPDNATVLSVSCTENEWKSIWHPYFDLDTNYRKIRRSIPDDDIYLKNAAQKGSGIRILRQDKFEMLISFIISQRKSIPAIRTSVEKIVDMYGTNGFFPKPEEIRDATADDLTSCGLGYRVPYVLKAIRLVANGEVDLDELDRLSDDELFEKLKEFNGVGDKVANCVELFAYHRTGRAPVDTWIARVIEEHYDGINPFHKYGEVAGIMQQYMFFSSIAK